MTHHFTTTSPDSSPGPSSGGDAAEMSSHLELLLGRDLQYIRINGTVVGAGIGLILHVNELLIRYGVGRALRNVLHASLTADRRI